MATGALPNTIYYGYIDGVMSQMVFIHKRGEPPQPQSCMMAVPAAASDPKSRKARVLRDNAMSPEDPEKEINVRIVALTGLNGVKKKPLLSWLAGTIMRFEIGMPRLDDLERISREKTALPILPNNQPIFSDTSPPGGAPGGTSADDSQEEDGPFGAVVGTAARQSLTSTPLADHIRTTRAPQVSAGPSMGEANLVALMQQALGPINDRMQEMQRKMERFQQPQAQPPPSVGPTSRDAGTNAFGDIHKPSAVSFEEDAVDQRYRRLKPAGGLTQGTRVERNLEHEFERSAPDQSGHPTPAPLEEALFNVITMLQGQPSSKPTTSPWKCKGAAGQMAWNQLHGDLNATPQVVLDEFDTAVRRLSLRVDRDANKRPSGQEIIETWRQHAPLKDHKSLIRLSELMIHILAALRRGDTVLAEARLVLGLAMIDQTGRDHGRFHRSAAISMQAEPPFHVYQPAPALQEGSKAELKLGGLSQFCSLERSTVALAIFRDNSGLCKWGAVGFAGARGAP